MQIKIINQDKNGIIDCNGRDIRIRGTEIFCIEGTNTLSAVSLGKYNDKEEAAKVFERIISVIMTSKENDIIISMPEKRKYEEIKNNNKA